MELFEYPELVRLRVGRAGIGIGTGPLVSSAV